MSEQEGPGNCNCPATAQADAHEHYENCPQYEEPRLVLKPDPLAFMKAPLLLIRGLPGSGKTTMALALLHMKQYDVQLEADMYHVKLGEYVYEPPNALAAHRWCLETTRVMLHIGKRVVVSNTFVRLDEIQPYRNLGFAMAIQEVKGTWPSTHNVPEAIMDHMRKRWEELP